MNRYLLALIATTVLTACSLAPEMKQPDMTMPGQFKEHEEAKGEWKPAVSLEGKDRGKWWLVFNDEEIDRIIEDATSKNQEIKAALARVEQARETVNASAVSLLPDLDLNANAVRAKSADASAAAFGGPPVRMKPYTLYSAGVTASYEADLFGRVRDNEKALSFDADAQEALFKNMLLTVQTEVATQYFRLRATDAERELLRETVKVREEAARIMQKRLDVGSVSSIDVTRTTADLAAARADLVIVERQRAALENALAILLGKNPSDFYFAEMPHADTTPPLIPAGIPSTLLQRRPDIAAAQASMAAANRRIGVARTAFFPSLILSASGGFESLELSDVFKWSSRSWALGQQAGSALAMTLFDSGRTAAKVDVAHARYAEAIANYRQQVLVAMGDVENALTDQRLLAEQAAQVNEAAKAAAETLRLSQRTYDEGESTYFEVVDSQRNALSSGRAAIQTEGARMIAAVNVIRALGGQWETVAVPVAEPVADLDATAPVTLWQQPETIEAVQPDLQRERQPQEPAEPPTSNQVTLPE